MCPARLGTQPTANFIGVEIMPNDLNEAASHQ
jgi:hypothetical protein